MTESIEHLAAKEHLDDIEAAENRLATWRAVATASAVVWLALVIAWALAPNGSALDNILQAAAWCAIGVEIVVMFWPVAKAEQQLRELGCAECAYRDYDRTYPDQYVPE